MAITICIITFVDAFFASKHHIPSQTFLKLNHCETWMKTRKFSKAKFVALSHHFSLSNVSSSDYFDQGKSMRCIRWKRRLPSDQHRIQGTHHGGWLAGSCCSSSCILSPDRSGNLGRKRSLPWRNAGCNSNQERIKEKQKYRYFELTLLDCKMPALSFPDICD